jgi:hypothetical protein
MSPSQPALLAFTTNTRPLLLLSRYSHPVVMLPACACSAAHPAGAIASATLTS